MSNQIVTADVRRKMGADGKMYFSVVDTMARIRDTDYEGGRRYWKDIKKKLKAEGFQLEGKILQLKMMSTDGKRYLTDVADLETMFRILQSIPSPKVEPIKQWLAQAGTEKIDAAFDPDKKRKAWRARGYAEAWITERTKGIGHRHEFTAELYERGCSGKDIAQCTNAVYQECFDGKSANDLLKFKGLKKGDTLRDHFSKWELHVTDIAETTATMLAEEMQSQGLEQNLVASHKGGKIGFSVRGQIEDIVGHSIMTQENALTENQKKRRAKLTATAGL